MQSLQPKVEKMEAAWARLHTITGAETPEEVIAYFEGDHSCHVCVCQHDDTRVSLFHQGCGSIATCPAAHAGALVLQPSLQFLLMRHKFWETRQGLGFLHQYF